MNPRRSILAAATAALALVVLPSLSPLAQPASPQPGAPTPHGMSMPQQGGQMPHQGGHMGMPHQGGHAAMHASPMHGAMHQMERDMHIAPSGDVDVDFARMMIPHHQGAVEMAKAQLEHGKDPELKKIAQEIIRSQPAEIEQLKAWLAKHKK